MSGRLPLERFAQISLEDLVARAELLTRIDRKYLVPLEAAHQLVADIAPGARVLEIDGRREFAYESLYFDTPDRLSYRLTALRRRRRFKIRTRRYLDTGAVFLELKSKNGRGGTVKQRIPHPADDAGSLTRRGAAYLGARLAELGHDPAIADDLRPVLRSRYRRTTLLMPDGGRATIDTELDWDDPGGGRLTAPAWSIVESKSAGAAGALDRALWRRGHRPSGISKFGTGTAALHPELPANKWARTLRGPLATASHRS